MVTDNDPTGTFSTGDTLSAEPLLRKGLVWYLPSYSTVEVAHNGRADPNDRVRAPAVRSDAIDYLIRDKRDFDVPGADPTIVKSKVVRPVLQIDLPFIEGVSLRDFSKITTAEFDSYRAFRSFLRNRFLQMEEGLNADGTEVALALIREEIEDQVRAVTSEMQTLRRKRAWAATGAVAGTSSALLVAVNSALFEAALAALGLAGAGSLWQYFGARAENSYRPLKSGKWYYVWLLTREFQTL
ncbi:hypothetical protein GCM10009837_67690 [Streptomyces durmitorensis]|uniref:Uncharacterized protein n=1 Tax=Streptomyces durmitorensis TaxID=319947 RepID=A0ABY4Q5A0_9ACTN|nr:hypothetical protein [Streptomyces durmitorensis]UQT61247.1 hypothetical protein M4V62_42690 [Streptomyces durmitorensis]